MGAKHGIEEQSVGLQNLSRRDLTKQIGSILGMTGVAGLAAMGCEQPRVQERTTSALQGSAGGLWFDSYTELRAVSGGTSATSTNVAIGRGPDTGGVFVWTTDTTSADDSGTIIVPSGTRTGCWKRVFEGALDVKWFGATGDGSTDDSAAIRDALAALPPAGGTVFVPPGTYRVSRESSNSWCLKIPISNVTLTGGGHDVTTIKLLGSQAGYANVVFADTLSKILVQDLAIDGYAAGQSNAQHGIALAACTDTTITRVAIRNTSGSGINCTGTMVRTIVTDSFLANAAGPSIGLQSFVDLSIAGCHFSGIVSSNTHVLQTSGYQATNAVVNGCTFLGDSSTNGVFFRGASSSSLATDISVVGNVFSGLYCAVFLGVNANGFAISGNVVDGCAIAVASANYSVGYAFASNSNVSITGNTLRNLNASGTESAIFVANASGCVIASNVIACSTGRQAIMLAHVQAFTVTGNSISITNTETSGALGIYAVRSLDGVIASNIVSMPGVSSATGIYLYGDSYGATARILSSDNSLFGAMGNGIVVDVAGASAQIGLGQNFIPSATTPISGQTDATAAYPQVGRYTVAGKKRTTGTAAPGSGAWLVGDVVMNTTPSAGGYIGWVCVSAGSPGTWKGYGSVQS